jgi:hypothetical protein
VQKKLNYLKAAFTLLLAIYGIKCALNRESFLDGVNLIAHEAGHLLFGYLGEFIMVIGGTVGQLFIPAATGVYFFMRREFYSTTVALFWFGQNMINISVYVKDAALMELPLVNVGGGEGMHDWNYLLLKFNVLAHDQVIGNLVYGLGCLIIVASVCLGFYYSLGQGESPLTGKNDAKGGNT